MNELPIICYTCAKEKQCSHAHLPGERLVGCGGYVQRSATNADRIRAKSDEELALLLGNSSSPDGCAWLDWLKSPVEVDE